MELDLKSFRKQAKGTGCVQEIDLHKAFPVYLKSAKTLPGLLKKIISQTTESFMDSEGGCYAFGNNLSLHLYFNSNLPEATAKIKIEHLCKMMEEGFKDGEPKIVKKSDKGPESQNKKKDDTDHTLSKLVQKGLPENPTDKELQFWTDRVTQDLYHMGAGQFIPKDLIKLGVQYDLEFYPLWFAAQEMVSGCFCHLLKAPRPKQSAEKCRQDFALLSGALIAALKMLEKKQKGIVFIPLDLVLMQENDLYALYSGCMHKLSGLFKATIGFEVRGLPSGSLSPALKKKIKALSQDCKAVVLHASVLSPDDFTFDGFKPFAYGLDYASVNMGGDVGTMLKRAVRKYKEQGVKTIITNVADAQQAGIAAEAGADFVTGPGVGRQKGVCHSVHSLKRNQIGG